MSYLVTNVCYNVLGGFVKLKFNLICSAALFFLLIDLNQINLQTLKNQEKNVILKQTTQAGESSIMAEVGFPGQHTTTTTVTSSTTVQTNIRFDPFYVRTLPGILKVVQVACNLLGFICIQFSYFNNAGKGSYFSWVSMVAFWFTGILLGLYLFHIVEKFYKIPWLKIEFVFCALWTLLYLIAASLATTVHDNPHSAAAFFGFVATVAYCADAYLKYSGARAGGLAQGSRVVSKQTTSTVEAPPPREGY